MAERTRAGEGGSPLCCEVAWVRRRRALEDMPMNRVDARAGEGADDCPCPCGDEAEDGGCGCDCARLVALLEELNKLLCDLLGAVNCLAAAQLAAANQKAQ